MASSNDVHYEFVCLIYNRFRLITQSFHLLKKRKSLIVIKADMNILFAN